MVRWVDQGCGRRHCEMARVRDLEFLVLVILLDLYLPVHTGKSSLIFVNNNFDIENVCPSFSLLTIVDCFLLAFHQNNFILAMIVTLKAKFAFYTTAEIRKSFVEIASLLQAPRGRSYLMMFGG